jgi:hypothetical protein
MRTGFVINIMRNSAAKCYMGQCIHHELDVAGIFSCICVYLENLDGESEIRME